MPAHRGRSAGRRWAQERYGWPVRARAPRSHRCRACDRGGCGRPLRRRRRSCRHEQPAANRRSPRGVRPQTARQPGATLLRHRRKGAGRRPRRQPPGGPRLRLPGLRGIAPVGDRAEHPSSGRRRCFLEPPSLLWPARACQLRIPATAPARGWSARRVTRPVRPTCGRRRVSTASLRRQCRPEACRPPQRRATRPAPAAAGWQGRRRCAARFPHDRRSATRRLRRDRPATPIRRRFPPRPE